MCTYDAMMVAFNLNTGKFLDIFARLPNDEKLQFLVAAYRKETRKDFMNIMETLYG